MRKLRYQVASTLDGFIAGPEGEYDWIVMDPTIDFAALFRQFDTAIMGRRTFEAVLKQGRGGTMPGMDVVVASRTLRAKDYPAVTVISKDIGTFIRSLKEKPGKDIWLFGGGELFRSLIDEGVVDTVELAVMPVLIGSGLPVLPPGDRVDGLQLRESKALPSGIVMLTYSVKCST